MVTVSPLTPVPEMTGSAVVVSVLPLAGLAIVGAAGAVGTLTVNVSVAAVELGPPEAACVAVTVWLALLSGDVGVKLQALLTTGAVPTRVPSIEMVTVSPLTPVPEMTGSAVVVSVLPLAGLAIVGAAGSRARAIVGREDLLQRRIVAECGVSDLDAPAVGIVERGGWNHRSPCRKNLLLLRGSRQDPVRISASAEGLIDRHDFALRYAGGFGRAYIACDDAVVETVRKIDVDRIWVEPEQIDVGVGGCV